MNNRIACAIGGVLLAASPVLHADDGWKFETAAYLWGAGMEGAARVDDLDIHVDMSFGDILDNLELGLMGAARAYNGRFTVGGDLVWMALGHQGAGGGPSGEALSGDLDIDQTAITADAGYGLSDDFYVIGGLRYNEVDVKLDLHGTVTEDPRRFKADEDESWLDPFVGVMWRVPFGDQWSLNLRGEVGGFGVGSDFAGLLQATLRWDLNDHIGFVAGYRYFDMEFNDNNFTYDIVTQGPAVGLITSFH